MISSSLEDSRLFVRTLEAETYSNVISVFRAQGSLDSYKNLILEHLRKALNISWSRHIAEIRRATADCSLTKVATELNPTCDVTFDWMSEACRTENRRMNFDENDETFIAIADNLQCIAAKHNSSLENQQNSLYNILKLPPQKNLPEQILAIFEKHLSPVPVSNQPAQQNEPQTSSNGQKRKIQISLAPNADDSPPPANPSRPIAVPKPQEKPKNQSKSKFSKKSIDVPILQYREAVSSVYQSQAIQRLPANQSQKRSGNQAKRHKKCPIREESASETFSPPLNYDFAQNMAANLEDINFGLTPVDEPYPSTESPSVVKMETGESAHQTFDPQPFYSANVTPLSVPTAPTPPTSKSEPNLSAVRAFSGITVKTGVKSTAVPQASISGSPGKQSLRAVFTNFHAQQTSRMVPEIARSIGAGGQKVIVLPSSNLRRRLNITDLASPSLMDPPDQSEPHDVINPANPITDTQIYVAQAKSPTTYNTKGAGSDVIVVRRTSAHPDQQAASISSGLLETSPSNTKLTRLTAETVQTNVE